MQVRAAGPEDADRIADIWNPLIRDTAVTFTGDEKSPVSVAADIAARMDQCLPFLVVEGAGEVLGFATFSQFRGGPGYARTMEHTIILAPEARGQGAGRLLMQTLEAKAVKVGVHSLIAGISAENPNAVAFHKHLGFEKVGHVPQAGWKFGRWMDLILLQKLLNPAR